MEHCSTLPLKLTPLGPCFHSVHWEAYAIVKESQAQILPDLCMGEGTQMLCAWNLLLEDFQYIWRFA